MNKDAKRESGHIQSTVLSDRATHNGPWESSLGTILTVGTPSSGGYRSFANGVQLFHLPTLAYGQRLAI
jgi:hypothetical protein